MKEEIAATFEQAGLPPRFPLAAAEIVRALAGDKDAAAPPSLAEAAAALAAASEPAPA